MELKNKPTLAFLVSLAFFALTQPVQSAGYGQVLKLLAKSFPAPSAAPGSTRPNKLMPTVGLRDATSALNNIPAQQRPTSVDVQNAYQTLLARAGITQALMVSCPSCIPAHPKLPEENLRAARLIIENDALLTGKAVGNGIAGALDSLHPSTGRRVLPSSKTPAHSRDKVIVALAEALAGLRAGALEEDQFADALAANLRKLAETPKPASRFGLEEISYDAGKGTLEFKVRYRSTKAKIANLNIKTYVDKMIGLVFGAGGVYLLQPESGTQEPPPFADAAELAVAKEDHAQAMANARTVACDNNAVSTKCFNFLGDPQTELELNESVWAQAILELLE